MPVEPTAFVAFGFRKHGSDSWRAKQVWAGLPLLLQQLVVFHLRHEPLLWFMMKTSPNDVLSLNSCLSLNS